MTTNDPLPQISIGDCNPVPVFNCHIALKKDAATGSILGRVANFPGIDAAGTSERDVLQSLARQFKEAVKQLHKANTPISLVDAPEILPDESQRFLPIHL